MASLLDIADVGETVRIRGAGIPIKGVSARGIAILLSRFPALGVLMTGREVVAADLIQIGPDFLAALIAAGTGHPGEEEYEAAADDLTIDEQSELVEAILRVTLPRGVGPLVARLQAMGNVLGAGAAALQKAPASNSPKASKP